MWPRLVVLLAGLSLWAMAGPALAKPRSKRNDLALRWSTATRSPQPSAAARGADAPLYAACGTPDAGLIRVAERVLERRIAAKPPFDERELRTLARSAGVPHPWPRAWLLSDISDQTRVVKRLERWQEGWARRGQVRCGIARGADPKGTPLVAAVATDAAADLASVRRRVRASEWLSLEAQLHESADGVKVVLLGPRGRPRRVLASLSDGRVVSRFTLDQPGRWLVQVVAYLEHGPRPVLEVELFADARPPSSLEPLPNRREGGAEPSLTELLNRARRDERLEPLERDPGLDAVALIHARAMVLEGSVSHDVGSGGPHARVREAGIRARQVGENVARAGSMRRLHSTLWDSPSHRENMLDGRFSRVGVAIVKDAQERLWAVQLFAD